MLPYKNAKIKRSHFACLIVDFGLAKRHIEKDGQVPWMLTVLISIPEIELRL